MIEKKVTITNKHGLHMRPAMMITDEAAKYECAITISKDDTTIDAESIMQLTMLAVTEGEEITFIAEGKDEEEAIKALTELIESDFKDKKE